MFITMLTRPHYWSCHEPDESNHTPRYFFKIHCNIILPSMPMSSSGLFPLGFPTYAFLITPMHATCPTHLILLRLVTLVIFGNSVIH